MVKPASPTALATAAGISVPYASQLLSDDPSKRRDPSRPLAIHIFRQTGWRHPTLSALSDDQLDTLEQVEPWSRPASDAQAAA